MNYDNIPNELKDLRHWVCWRYEPQPDNKKPKKIPFAPFNPDKRADTLNPKTWSTFKQAAFQHDMAKCDGLGFVLTNEDDYVAVDLDHAFDDSAIERTKAIVGLFNSYTERSPSGQGVRIFIKAHRQVYHQSQGIEVYSHKQYVTLTGNCKTIKPIEWRDAELEQFLATYFTQQNQAEKPQTFDNAPIPFDDIPDVDKVVWTKAFSSKNGDTLYAQYKGTWSHVSADKSVGDYSFLNSLAYWCNGNPKQMRRMALQSGMRRAKWFEKRGDATWLEYEIDAITQRRKAA